MLKPEKRKSTYPRMTEEQRGRFERAVAEETAAKDENIAAARQLIPQLLRDCEQAVEIVARLRAAREAAGVSLAEIEAQTGIRKSALSRLENSKAPNPTLSTLQRYADAIGSKLVVALEKPV